MSVVIDPPELSFQRPFTREVSQSLRLQNPGEEPLAFKVKTTAPKQYCVRPNSGRIEPGKTVEVQVLLQALKEDIPLDVKCRDKFLVQSVGISADQDFSNVASIWQHVEKTAKSSIQERKIRVVYLAADSDSSHQDRNSTLLSTPRDDPPAYTSPSPQHGSPGAGEFATPSRTSGPVSTPASRPSDAKNLGEIRSSASNPATNSTLGTAAAAVANAVPTSADDLKAQLAEAKAQIAKLTEQASEGLRQRRGGAQTAASTESGSGSSTAVAQRLPAAAGVPVQIVAALCLLSFLLAYFFF